MSVLTIHLTDGVCRAARTDDPGLVGIEVITIIDGTPASCLRPELEDAILAFVGAAREK